MDTASSITRYGLRVSTTPAPLRTGELAAGLAPRPTPAIPGVRQAVRCSRSRGRNRADRRRSRAPAGDSDGHPDRRRAADGYFRQRLVQADRDDIHPWPIVDAGDEDEIGRPRQRFTRRDAQSLAQQIYLHKVRRAAKDAEALREVFVP